MLVVNFIFNTRHGAGGVFNAPNKPVFCKLAVCFAAYVAGLYAGELIKINRKGSGFCKASYVLYKNIFAVAEALCYENNAVNACFFHSFNFVKLVLPAAALKVGGCNNGCVAFVLNRERSELKSFFK